MTEPLAPATSQGLSRDITDAVRAMILDGTLPPGERLLPRHLQERFGVSIIPVREALRSLESEGFIVTLPRRGTQVSPVSMAELREVYALRRSIEPPLMRSSARERGDDEVARAQAAFEAMNVHVGVDVDAFLTAHRTFHRVLLEPSLGPLTERILTQLWLTADRYVRLGVTTSHVDKLAQDDHAALLKAYVDGQADIAERVALSHLQLVERSVSCALESLLG